MVYTAKWKKNVILLCGLFENLVFTGNILGWSALNHMLKTEGVYDEYCFNEISIASNINHTYLSSHLDDHHLNNLNNSSAKLNSTLLNNISEYITELPSFNTTNSEDYDEDELIDNSNTNNTNEEINRDEDNNQPESSTETDPEINDESIRMIKNVPSATTLSTPVLIRNKRANSQNRVNSSQIDLLIKPSPLIAKRNCKKQDTILNLAYTIGTFLNGFTAFVWGFLLERYGLRKVRLLIKLMKNHLNSFFLSAGCCLLCFTSKSNPHLIFPAVALLCFGGVPLRIADMQFANLYPSLRSSIITLYSGAFSASSIVFVVLKYVYEHGIDYYYTTGLLFIVSLLLLPTTFFLLPPDAVREDDSKPIPNKKDPTNHAAFTIENRNADQNDYCNENEIKFSRQKFNKFYKQNFNTIQPIKLEKFQYIGSPKLKRKEDTETVDRSAPVELDAKIMVNSNAQGPDKLDLPLTKLDNSNEPKIRTDQLPLKLSLYSIPYIVHQYWFCWLITYMIMYVGSMNLWIRRITDDVDKASFYLKIYGLLQVFSLIIAPMAGAMMDYEVNKASKEKDAFKRKLRMAKAGFWPILLTNLSLIGVIICKFFDHETAIYISIILNTFLRSFLIAVASAYLRIRFPADHFSKLLGIMSTLGAIMTMIQFPLFIWESSTDQVIWVNLFNAFMTLLSFSNPILLLINPLQEQIIRKQQKLESLYKN